MHEFLCSALGSRSCSEGCQVARSTMAMRGLCLLWLLATLAPLSLAQDRQALRGVQNKSVSLIEESEDAGDADTSDETSETERSEEEMEMLKKIDREVSQMQRAAVVVLLAHVALTLITGLLYAAWPRHTVSPEEVLRQHGQDFQYGLFDGCCHSLRICCCSVWCLPLRWAETSSSPKVNFLGCSGPSFLLALFLFELVLVISKLPAILIACLSRASTPTPPAVSACLGGFALLFSLTLVVLQVLQRQHLRRRYGLSHGTCCSCTCDFLTWCFCGCCAAMQEALQVDYVGEPVEVKDRNAGAVAI
ncbi:unnamed protein product [Effrenium voratum]|nr:unnamed protein product [Effrenium voratum]